MGAGKNVREIPSGESIRTQRRECMCAQGNFVEIALSRS